MKRKIAFLEDVARRTSVKAAVIENDLAYLAKERGTIHGDSTVLTIPWMTFDDKYDYMTTSEPFTNSRGETFMVPADEEEAWLGELESAGIIEFESDDDAKSWIVYFSTRYLIGRCA